MIARKERERKSKGKNAGQNHNASTKEAQILTYAHVLK